MTSPSRQILSSIRNDRTPVAPTDARPRRTPSRAASAISCRASPSRSAVTSTSLPAFWWRRPRLPVRPTSKPWSAAIAAAPSREKSPGAGATSVRRPGAIVGSGHDGGRCAGGLDSKALSDHPLHEIAPRIGVIHAFVEPTDRIESRCGGRRPSPPEGRPHLRRAASGRTRPARRTRRPRGHRGATG